MIYSDLTKLAMQIAFIKHRDQVDKAGMPYIFHPFYLATQMTTEETICVALLHDVIEDTDMTIEDLKGLKFPKEVLDALYLMTHDESVPYLDHVKKIKTNPIARKVKIADLRHNSDLSRLSSDPVESDFKRLEKYKLALEILLSDD